jgi:NAD(P)-dependent dehydrogenase (short-subunit alcohol dehydrogenase family)
MPSVLVTGAGRGIGRVTALRLASAGWDVLAGVRRREDGEALSGDGGSRIAPVVLDVTNAEQLAALPAALPARLDAIVNNAGVVVGGPIEGVPLEELRRQLEVNVVGQVAVTQAALPRLRESRGRFALEGLADALRMELAPWGIKVVLVEPAQTDTDMWREADSALESTVGTLSAEHRKLYAKHIEGFRRSIPRSRRMASPADTVAAAIERALTASRPRARYVVGAGPRVQGILAQLTPTAARDALLRTATGVPRRP